MLVITLPEPVKRFFWAYDELLFKWEDIYRIEALHSMVEFDVYRPKKTDKMRSPVYGDKILTEQVLYNFIGNAIKYCYYGTKIKLECAKDNTKAKSPHILTVTNYGRKFRCDNPYVLNERGDNVEGIEGMGIGLYNAKRIANAHGDLLDYKCEQISEYNVPIIEQYIKSKYADKDMALVEPLRKELHRLNELGEIDNIVAYNNKDLDIKLYRPVDDELTAFIDEPTYKVTAMLVIPARGMTI
jgi:hypothetical protein